MIVVFKDKKFYDLWSVLTKAKNEPKLYHNIKNLKWDTSGKFPVIEYRDWGFIKVKTNILTIKF